MIGETIETNEGQKELIESVLSYTEALNGMFKRLMLESKDCRLREITMWKELEQLAKEQYPDYDSKVHILNWNWFTRRLTIGTHEQQRKGLLD